MNETNIAHEAATTAYTILDNIIKKQSPTKTITMKELNTLDSIFQLSAAALKYLEELNRAKKVANKNEAKIKTEVTDSTTPPPANIKVHTIYLST